MLSVRQLRGQRGEPREPPILNGKGEHTGQATKGVGGSLGILLIVFRVITLVKASYLKDRV